MKIFLDTNFILDFFIREDYFQICDEFLKEVRKSGGQCYVSYLSVANFAYIARKQSKEALITMVTQICESFIVVKNTEDQIRKALSSDFKDFEDALQYQCAKTMKCDCIITRNQKDFAFSDIPAMSASEYLTK